MEIEDKIVLSKYRIEKSHEEIKASDLLFNNEMYNDSINRSYYAIFHAISAVCALDEYNTRSHSGVLKHFSFNYLKSEKLDRKLGRIANKAFTIRNKSDYNDFYYAEKFEAEQQLNDAKYFVDEITNYLKKRSNSLLQGKEDSDVLDLTQNNTPNR